MGYLRNLINTRRKRRKVAIVLLILLALWLISRYSSNTLTLPKLLYIPSGTIERIAASLHEQGVDVSSDKLDSISKKREIIPGWIRFDESKSISITEFFGKLLSRKREKTRRIVMYSGDTIHLFTQKLARQTKLSKDKLLNAYYRYSPYSDGGILAGYYRLPYRLTPEAAMYYMTKSSTNQFKKITAYYGMTYNPKIFRKYLITASIIQKETWRSDEMPFISSVIHNRLLKGIKLQLDATLNYGPYAHTPVTPQRIRTDESRFNTYKYFGLPPEPIGSVSKEALESAFAPADTRFMFFVKGIDDRHIFSKTYKDHLKLIQSIKNKKAMILMTDENINANNSAITDSTDGNHINAISHPPVAKHQ